MRKVKSFPIEKADEANAFMEEHPPMGDDKNSGISLHNGHIFIQYSDGVINPKETESYALAQVNDETRNLFVIRHSQEEAKAALPDTVEAINKEVPAGYKMGLGDGALRKLLTKDGTADYISNEHVKAARDHFDALLAAKINLDNMILTNDHEIKRLEYSIQAYQTMLAKPSYSQSDFPNPEDLPKALPLI